MPSDYSWQVGLPSGLFSYCRLLKNIDIAKIVCWTIPLHRQSVPSWSANRTCTPSQQNYSKTLERTHARRWALDMSLTRHIHWATQWLIPRLEMMCYEYQDNTKDWVVHIDSARASCRTTRRWNSGGWLSRCRHIFHHWSRVQARVARSTAEAEL